MYVAELKKLARYCKFKDNLNENLRDQFVCGLQSEVIRQRLFAEADSITYTDAVRVATSLEAAERDAAAVDGRGSVGASTFAAAAGPDVSRNTVSRRSSDIVDLTGDLHRMQLGGCTACGDYRHTKMECRFSKYQCSKCKTVGHLRRMCQENGDSVKHRDRAQARKDGGGAGMTRRGARVSVGGYRGASRGTGRAWHARSGAYQPTMHVFETQGEEQAEEVFLEEEPIYQMSLSQYRPVQ
ncbi:uncharacterized protein LOC113507973 [Trichoplusia ni]|uniref:Uncharacterized protein LOC113507973 n=1 Tax=Trichoplusia ni TaxID=7111 RepID=A0A7E5X0M0_TRINI|nr:uncharacterized protein LOC113507973 [Trichoplusia ni]